jgi:AcrR family transcriptional regulator
VNVETKAVAPTGGRQAQRSNMSSKRLLDAAAELISEKGYARTTLADIGRRAGYSHGLVTQRFGTKAGLLSALIDRMARRFGHDELLATVSGRTGAEALAYIVREVRADIERSPATLRSFYALMFEAANPASEIHEHLAEMNDVYRRSVASLIEAGVTAGTMRDDLDTARVANQFSATLRGISYFWLLDVEAYDVLGALEAYAETLELVYCPTS